MSLDLFNFLISEALKEAEKAYEQDEVPIGAVVAYKEKIIGRGFNKVESLESAISHAEIAAIEEASKYLKNWRLNECVLAVTIEPCTMCAGAIIQSRIPVVVFGANEPKTGAFGSVYDLSLPNQNIRIIRGVKEVECLGLIQRFFQTRRTQ